MSLKKLTQFKLVNSIILLIFLKDLIIIKK